MPTFALFRLAQLPEYQGVTLTPTQQGVREAVAHTWETATSLTTALPLLAGGFTSRLAQGAVLSTSTRLSTFSNGILKPLIRPAAWTASLLTEVTAFETTSRALEEIKGKSTNPQRWKWQGPQGFKTALFVDGITFGSLRGAGFAAQGENLLFRHAAQSTAMVAGNNLAGVLNVIPLPEQTLSEQFFHAETINVQIGATMAALHATLPGIHGWERGLDVTNRSLATATRLDLPKVGHPIGLFLPEPALAIAPSGQKEINRDFEKLSPLPPPLQHFSVGEVLSGEKREVLGKKYSALFLEQGEKLTGPPLVEMTLDIPFPSASDFHERFLEGLLQAPNRGTRDQLHTVEAIKDIFTLNALHTASGSFENALHQLLFTQTLKMESREAREKTLLSLFAAMEEGLSRERLVELIKTHGSTEGLESTDRRRYPLRFVLQNARPIVRYLRGYRRTGLIQLFNFIESVAGKDPPKAHRLIEVFGKAREKYSPDLIDSAMKVAQVHPLGKLILMRMLQIFAVEDIPEKLRELLPERHEDTLEAISRYRDEGKTPEQIAQALNGTRHTAYFQNLSLARKLVDVMLDVKPFLEDPSLTQERYENLKSAIESLLKIEASPEFEEFMLLFELDPITEPHGRPDPFIPSIRDAVKNHRLQVIFLDDKPFDDKVSQWGKAHVCQYSLFVKAKKIDEVDTIYVRKMPTTDLNTSKGKIDAFYEFNMRMDGFRHEWEHWRHSSGNYEGKEPDSAPFNFAEIGRTGRSLTESLSILEEERWHIRNVENYFGPLARRMGINLALLSRNLTDISYFSNANQKIAEQIQVSLDLN